MHLSIYLSLALFLALSLACSLAISLSLSGSLSLSLYFALSLYSPPSTLYAPEHSSLSSLETPHPKLCMYSIRSGIEYFESLLSTLEDDAAMNHTLSILNPLPHRPRCWSVDARGMCVVQWKILEPWEVGEQGQVTPETRKPNPRNQKSES